jgi:hypothetical protein
VNGLVFGGLLGLVALGLALIFGVMRIVNFAHGEFITLGAYATFLLVTLLAMPPLAGVPVGFVLGALAGWFIQRTVVSRVTGRPERWISSASCSPVADAPTINGLGRRAQKRVDRRTVGLCNLLRSAPFRISGKPAALDGQQPGDLGR